MTAPPDTAADGFGRDEGPVARDRRAAASARRRGAPSKGRRRISTGVRLGLALLFVGGAYVAFAPGVQANADPQPLSAAAQKGKELYDTSCISCHGRNAQGVEGRGPSLIGVGEAAVWFQVSTGRMPATGEGAQVEARDPKFNSDEAEQLGAYIQELGGGPTLPQSDNLRATGAEAISRGGVLFRLNCSSCHTFGAGGGALSSGKFAPNLAKATDRQIYAAMLSGPQNMPVFGDNQLTPDEKADIIAYIQNLNSDADPGGWGLGRLGPVPEGIAIFLVGVVALVITTLWIAGKS